MTAGELIVLSGPPAVGKMTVGRAVCAQTAGDQGREWRLFHNHHTIEPLHEIFGQQSPAFATLNAEFRRRVIEEAAVNGVRLVFTTVWNLAGERDTAYIRSLVAPYSDRSRGPAWRGPAGALRGAAPAPRHDRPRPRRGRRPHPRVTD